MPRKQVWKIHRDRVPVSFNGKEWVFHSRERTVRVMAEAEGYAMVRCKGSAPYVADMKELHDA